MSLLTICQIVASQIPIAAPSAIVGNTDETAMLLLALAQDAGEALSRKPDLGWVNQVREFDFTTSSVAQQSGTIANSGPGGVAVISGLTIASGANRPANPVASTGWYAFGTGVANNSLITAVTSADPNSSVTLSLPATQTGAGQFLLGQSDYALPSDFKSPVDNTFWDRSRFWSMRGPLSPQQWQLYKSSVIGRASIQRRFRFRRSSTGGQILSIDPVPTDNGSQLVFEYVSTGWCESQAGAFQSSWEADTDMGVIDEYLIRLGLKYRVLRRKGMSYAEELDEYEREVSKAMSKDGGAAILTLTPNDNLTLIGPWNLPETNFGGVLGS
jgi:hypothetical protein